MKNRKGMKKFAISLACITLALQSQAMDECTVENKQYNLIGFALFSGSDLVSNTVKCATNSATSHIGVLLADLKDENQWYCFESTGSKEEVLKGIYPHVRLTDWDSIVENYKGSVSYRLFLFNDMERIDPIQVTSFVEEYNGKSYTKNPLKLFGALLNINSTSHEGVSNTVFCSELSAKMLMNFGILQEGVESNCLPADFTSKKMDVKKKSRVTLNFGVDLTPEFIEK